MLIFVRNEKGRPEAQVGGHDDLVMGLAITYYIREQQTFKLLPIEAPQALERNYNAFGVRSSASIRHDDFGSEIEVI